MTQLIGTQMANLYLFTILAISSMAMITVRSEPPVPFNGAQKLTQLHFYLHETTSTSVQVAQSPTTNQSSTFFGAVFVIDDLLRVGPDAGSRLIGRAQGLSVSASMESATALLMATNFVFTEGKFNGSSITMLGRNNLAAAERELPIVGGSGVFRFANGYVLTKTHSIDSKEGVVIAEYDLYVLHY